MSTFEKWLRTYRPFRGAETPPDGQAGQQSGGLPVAPAEPAGDGSGAQQGAGDGAANGQGAEALAPLMERMDAMSQSIEQLAQAGPQQQGPGAGQGGEDPTQMPGFLGYDAYGNPMYQPPEGQFDPQSALGQAMPGQAAVPQFDQGQLQQLQALGLMDPATGEINEPAAQQFLGMGQQLQQSQAQYQALAGQLGNLAMRLDANDLESEFPELSDPAKGEAIVDKAIEAAQAMGNPMLARNPGFIKLVFQAEKAQGAAAGETPLSGQQATALESAQGAGAPAEPAPDAGDSVVEAGNRGGFWGFGGQQ